MADKKYNQLDLFVANLVDVSPKSDQSTMEFPFFALGKIPDREQFIWKKGKSKITITPNKYGRATIYDKDILIYLFGQLAAAMKDDFIPPKTIKASSYDILTSIKRGTGGKDYLALKDALRRLRGTAIETNIKNEDGGVNEEFSLIQSWKTIEKNPDGNMSAVQITLSDWLYKAITDVDILTYDPEYFKLTSGLDRRLYELFRKHCGVKKGKIWTIYENNLFKKSGSIGTQRKFRYEIKKREGKDILGYTYSYNNETTLLTVSQTIQKKGMVNY